MLSSTVKNPIPLIILSGACGGSVYPLIKIANEYQIPKFGYIFWEALIITAVLSIYSLFRGETKLIDKSEWRYYLFCAFTNIIIPQLIFFFVAPKLPASVVGLVMALTPMFVYVALLLLFNEKYDRQKLFGVTLGLAGIIALFAPDLIDTDLSVDWWWLTVSFLLPIDHSVNRIYASSLMPEGSSSNSLAIGLFLNVTALMGIVMFLTGQVHNPFTELHPGDLALFAHAALMSMYYVIFFALAKIGAVQSSINAYVIPITAATWGIFIFNETLGVSFLVAASLVLLGLFTLNKSWQT